MKTKNAPLKLPLVLPILNTQSSFNTFAANPKVRKVIYVGDINCSGYDVLVSSGMNISLRASDLVELNDGFEVYTNGESFADVIVLDPTLFYSNC